MIEPSAFDLSVQAHRAAAIGLAQELERRSIEGELAKRLKAEARLPWPHALADMRMVGTISCLGCILGAAICETLIVQPLAGYRGCIGSDMQGISPWPCHLVMIY